MRGNLIALWADNNLDLTQHRHCVVVGEIAKEIINKNLDGEYLHRPRCSLPPQAGRELPTNAPPGLQALYAIAKNDICGLGFNPDHLYLYTLFQSGVVVPGQVLREGQWHFDLMRNLRDKSHQGKTPVVIGYGVSTILPTVYTTGLLAAGSLPAHATIENMQIHHTLGEGAEKAGLIFQARPGQVVRYDSMVLHRGEPNRTSTPLHRVFMNVSFSPVS
jgi:hypothetical protein